MRADRQPPKHFGTAFDCPHCGAYAHQEWGTAWDMYSAKPTRDPACVERTYPPPEGSGFELPPTTWMGAVDVARCARCGQQSLWVNEGMVWPPTFEAPLPHKGMPEGILGDYCEAGIIAPHSPRAAAALLRLAIQKLCTHLGCPHGNLNKDIGWLVSEKGLSPMVQQALDIVRVVGNNAVHPGEINLQDDRAAAASLFRLVNLIVEKTIAEPAHLAAAFEGLPEGARHGIAKRDGK